MINQNLALLKDIRTSYEKALTEPRRIGALPLKYALALHWVCGRPAQSPEKFIHNLLHQMDLHTKFFEKPKREVSLAYGVTYVTRDKYQRVYKGLDKPFVLNRKALRNLLGLLENADGLGNLARERFWWGALKYTTPEFRLMHSDPGHEAEEGQDGTPEIIIPDTPGVLRVYYIVDTLQALRWLVEVIAGKEKWRNLVNTSRVYDPYKVLRFVYTMLIRSSTESYQETRRLLEGSLPREVERDIR